MWPSYRSLTMIHLWKIISIWGGLQVALQLNFTYSPSIFTSQPEIQVCESETYFITNFSSKSNWSTSKLVIHGWEKSFIIIIFCLQVDQLWLITNSMEWYLEHSKHEKITIQGMSIVYDIVLWTLKFMHIYLSLVLILFSFYNSLEITPWLVAWCGGCLRLWCISLGCYIISSSQHVFSVLNSFLVVVDFWPSDF